MQEIFLSNVREIRWIWLRNNHINVLLHLWQKIIQYLVFINEVFVVLFGLYCNCNHRCISNCKIFTIYFKIITSNMDYWINPINLLMDSFKLRDFALVTCINYEYDCVFSQIPPKVLPHWLDIVFLDAIRFARVNEVGILGWILFFSVVW